MEITEVGVRIVERSEDRLKAVCTMTIDDCFVVRDIKVVEGQHGLFVAMPSRKRTTRCPQCSHKNEIRSRFCADCGAKQPPQPNPRPQNGEKTTSHTDIAHPINTECRELIQEVILEAYKEEVEEYLAEQSAAAVEQGEPQEHAEDREFEENGDDRMKAPVEMEAPRDEVKPPRRDSRPPRRETAPPRREESDARRDGAPRRDDGPPPRRGDERRGEDQRSDDRPQRRPEPAPVARSDSRPPRQDSPRSDSASPAPMRSEPPRPQPERQAAPPVEEEISDGFGAGIL